MSFHQVTNKLKKPAFVAETVQHFGDAVILQLIVI